MQASDSMKLRTISSIIAIETIATKLELAVIDNDEEEIIILYKELKQQPDIIRAYLRGLSQKINLKINPNE